MYLYAETYVSGYEFSKKEVKTRYHALVEQFGVGDFVEQGTPGAFVKFTVAYWRKANAIHGWFVENVQGGEDECRPHRVGKEELKELREMCRHALTARDPSLLKPKEGFFFGSYDIDEWYWQDIESTVKQLDRVLEMPEEWGFEYQSSW
jgi:hypothetical protein